MKVLTLFTVAMVMIPALLPQQAVAQNQWQDMGVEAPLDVEYSELMLVFCLDPLDDNIVRPECMSDATEARHQRAQNRGISRHLRAGVAVITELWAGFQFVKRTYEDFQDLHTAVQQVLRGFDWKQPERTLYTLKYRINRFDRQMARAVELDVGFPRQRRDSRFQQVSLIATRALAVARDAEEASISLSDQTGGMTHRLAGGEGEEVVRVTVGGEVEDGDRDPLPPAPYDAPIGAISNVYGSAAQLPSSLASYEPVLMRAAVARAADPEDEIDVCSIEDGEIMDPAVMIERVRVMAAGAQMGADVVSSDVTQAREQVRAVRMREAEQERLTGLSSLLRLVEMF